MMTEGGSGPIAGREREVGGFLHTSRAETNCRGRRAVFRSAVFVSRSCSAVAMAVSSSDGFWRDGLFAAILLMGELMLGGSGSGSGSGILGLFDSARVLATSVERPWSLLGELGEEKNGSARNGGK